jgi:hypothetical protein
MPYQQPWSVSSLAPIQQLLPKVGDIYWSTKVRNILTASSAVAAKLRTGSQPIPSKLADKIEKHAMQPDPGSICIVLPLIILMV